MRDTGNVEGQLLVKEIACDEPTQINIFANKLKLVGAAGEGTYTFRNVKFNVSSGIFRVDVDIEFTADSGAMVSVFISTGGCILYLICCVLRMRLEVILFCIIWRSFK